MPTLRSAALILLTTLLGCGGLAEDADDPESGFHPESTCTGAPYPIILAHGMAGFEKLGPLKYFFQVADDLRGRGERVFISHVAPFESSAVRGAQLAADIDATLKATGACKVNLIAHSQGGLDARYAVSSLRRGDRVASVTTVATPHRGTPVADVALGLVPGFSYALIDGALRLYEALCGYHDIPSLKASLSQLTTSNMASRFNPQNPDDARVAYYSVAGRSALQIANAECQGGLWSNPQRGDLLDALFVLPGLIFREPNDGLVSISSARWGKFLGCVPADHLDEIGQFAHFFTDPVSGFYHRDMYRRIVGQLHSDGF